MRALEKNFEKYVRKRPAKCKHLLAQAMRTTYEEIFLCIHVIHTT